MAWEEEAGTGLSIAAEVAAKAASAGSSRAAQALAQIQAQRRSTGLQPVNRGIAPNPRASMVPGPSWPTPPPTRPMTPFEAWQDIQATNPNRRTITSFDDLMGLDEKTAEAERKKAREALILGSDAPGGPTDSMLAKQNRDLRIERSEAAVRKSQEGLGKRSKVLEEAEKRLAADPTAPAEDKELLAELGQAWKYGTAGFDELNPLAVAIKNLGTRAEYRKMVADWTKSKKGPKTTGGGLPMALPDASGEEIDAAGGLGGFMAQQQGTFGTFDTTPDLFDMIISRDKDGVDHIMSAEDWVRAKVADTRVDPNDSPAEAAQKRRLAGNLIQTLAMADTYGSYAQKRDAAYRVVLDENGEAVAGYLEKPDVAALQNLVAQVINSNMSSNETFAIEDWVEAYALERDAIGRETEGPGGTGSRGSSGYSGGGYRGYGGGGYGGGGGGAGGGVQLTSAETLKSMVDGIARSRLGRVLNADEVAAFVAHYHSLERAFVDAYRAGGDAFRVEPEAEAAAWIETQLMKEQAGQQAGKYVLMLRQLFSSGTGEARISS